jgi:ribosomal protein L29
MKKHQLQELRGKKVEELSRELSGLQQKRFEAYVSLGLGKEKNLKVVKNIRRDIAQIMTLLRLKASEAQAVKEKGDKAK